MVNPQADFSVSPTSPPLRDQHLQAITQCIQTFEANKPSSHSVQQLLIQLCQKTDQTLCRLWQDCALPADFALVAVGGYGRGELFPYSDVDILILMPDGADLNLNNTQRIAVEQMVSRIWDLGVYAGTSVRTVSQTIQAAVNDITIQTAQLEARLVTGNSELYSYYKNQFKKNMDVIAFVHAKISEMRRRHQKHEDSPYALEPNCKESPGGLRDLHVILWLTKAAELGHNWHELYANGIATRLEMRQLIHNEAWLKILRTHLHLIAKRDENRLLFDMQEPLAQALGYHAQGEKRASEVFMRRYYRTAKAIIQINQILIMSIAGKLLHTDDAVIDPIDTHFQEKAAALDIVQDTLYRQNPHEILRTFLVFAQNPSLKTLSVRTLRALYNARNTMNAPFRKDIINAQTFMAILQAPQGVYHALKLMNQTSVLGRYLWVFREIVGQMQHDLFHVYTVDQHSMIVLRNMRRFFLPEHAHEYPLCSEIAASFDKPWLLYIAALFHDIAKGRGEDHSISGAREVRRFAQQHGIATEDEDFLAFLVEQHLTMSRIAQKEDTSDPAVIQHFVDLVGNERHLNALYLLTVADIRGTSPKVWNSWKAYLLDSLYHMALQIMGGHIVTPHALVEIRKADVRKELQKSKLPAQIEQALWSTLDIGYFMRHETSDIYWHTLSLYDKTRSPDPIVYTRTTPGEDILQVLIYTPDQPNLFARLCNYFSVSQLSIVNARIHTTHPYQDQKRWALDTFELLLPLEIRPQNKSEWIEFKTNIEHDLTSYLKQPAVLPPPPTARRLSRRARSFPLPPLIAFSPDEHRQRWLLNIAAEDRVGLLYAITRILSDYKINIELAKISTLGDRIEDTFQISAPHLDDEKFQAELEQTLSKAIQHQ